MRHILLAAALLAVFAAPAPAAEVVLVAKGSPWKYYAGPSAPAGAWQDETYDDAAWPSGPAPLGYGEAYIATFVPYGGNTSARWITTYFRRAFTLAEDPGTIPTLKLSINYDDGFVIYLNGSEVARRSIRPGPVAYDTLATPTHEGGAYEVVDLSAYIARLHTGPNQLAVEVHQSSPGSSDLVLDLELTHSAAPVVTRGPYIQLGGPSAMTVRWRTDLATPGRARYGNAPLNLDHLAIDPGNSTEHEVRITGLAPSQRYYYGVGTPQAMLVQGSEYWFDTNPLPGTAVPTRIWVIGDAGRANFDQQAVRDAYLAWTGSRKTDLWLQLGDNAYPSGLDSEYQAGVFDMYEGVLRNSVTWPTRGNHDLLYTSPERDYYDHFTLPTGGESGGVPSGTEAYYSFDYSDIHFICLDSEGTDRTPGGAMLAWLRQDVAATTRRWIIAYWHHPPYSDGSHKSDNDVDSDGRMGDMRRNVLPILDSTGVDLVLTGHSHTYERSFLLQGHYGISSTLQPEHIVDGGNGQIGGDGAYLKPTVGQGPFEGTVYVVDGSSGGLTDATLQHPVMVSSLLVLGSLAIDIDGTRLDARFISNAGVVRDSFTIVKGPGYAGVDPAPRPPSLRIAARPNPSAGGSSLAFALPRAGRARVRIVDATGRRVADLVDGFMDAGAHTIEWSGRDASGRPVAPGLYLAILEAGGERRAARVHRLR